MSNSRYGLFLVMGITAVIAINIKINMESNAPEKTTEILSKKYHLHDIKVGDYNFWCAKGALVRRHFEAKNENNEEIEGSLCANNFLFPDHIKIKIKPKV